MSTLFAILIILLLLSIPIVISVFLIILLIKSLSKKPTKKLAVGILIYIASVILLTILFTLLGVVTDPATWCEHNYEVVEEIAPTCVEDGMIESKCSLCDTENIEYIDKIDHSWKTVSAIEATCTEQGKEVKKCSLCKVEDIKYTDITEHSWVVDTIVIADCINDGYTIEQCEICLSTRKTDDRSALGHNMTEVTRIEPTYDTEGKIVTRCDRCKYEETETLAKLEYETIEFNGLKLTFGEYSFTEVDNMFSEYDKKPVVRIPVTVENISNSPHSLNIFYYTLFGSNGTESPDVGYYFDDDISQAGEILSGKSYTKYFHILYDGDGVYTIVLDDMLFDEKTVEIAVKK